MCAQYFIVAIGLYGWSAKTDDLTMPAIKFLGSVERTFLESTMSRDIAFLIYANCATCVIRLLKCSPYRYRSESALVLASISTGKNDEELMVDTERINIARDYHR